MVRRRRIARDEDRAPRAPAHAVRADLEAWSRAGRRWTRAALIGLGVLVLGELATLGHDLDYATIVSALAEDASSVSSERLLALDARTEPAWMLGLGLRLAFAVVFLGWLRHAFATAHRLGGGRWMTFSPGEAVGSFVVPFLNLYRPYVAMHELVRASDPHAVDDPDEDRAPVETAGYRDPGLDGPREAPALPAPPLAAWWAIWLASGVVGYFGARLAAADALSAAAAGGWIVVAADAGALAAAGLVGRVMVRIDDRQRELLRRLAASTPEARPADG